ncbi:unnamed protein product, partial [Adineta ricciae]
MFYDDPKKIQEIRVSDPRPSESNAIPSPGFHRIRRIPVGSVKILYWIRVWDCLTWEGTNYLGEAHFFLNKLMKRNE